MLVRVGSGAEPWDGESEKALKMAHQTAILDEVAELALWYRGVTYYLPIDRFNADHEEGVDR
jgi:hypothetical protein